MVNPLGRRKLLKGFFFVNGLKNMFSIIEMTGIVYTYGELKYN